MTTQQNSPGNSIYAPLIMVGLWCVHGFVIWYLSRELALSLWSAGFVALGVLLTQWFLRPRDSRTMVWRPGLFASTLAFTWVFWLIFNTFWDVEAHHAIAWPLIGFISTHESARKTARKRRASDIGV